MSEEPKKRGRPRKVELFNDAFASKSLSTMAHEASEAKSRAQTLAHLVWQGCSVSLNRIEKVKIVTEALASHGLSMEGIALPD